MRLTDLVPPLTAASLVTSLAALALSACQPKAPDDATGVLKVASQKGGTRSLMLAAHALDDAPYRVEWSEFPSAQTLLEALGGGAVDAGAVGDAPFVFAYAAGAKIKAVAATQAAGGGAATAIVVRDGSPIRNDADLKGRRIATGRGSVGHYLLLRVLERAGLTPKDVTVVYLNPGDAKAAFASGAVDAWATWGAYIRLAEIDDHAHVLTDGQGLMHGIGFEAATAAAIAGKRAVLADFLRRLASAQRWEKTHTADYARVLASETGLPPDVALYVATLSRGEPTAIDARVLAEEKDTLNQFVRAGVISAAPDIAGALDSSFGSPP